MQFEFQDKGNPMHTCIGLSSKMQIFENKDINQILRSKFVHDKFD